MLVLVYVVIVLILIFWVQHYVRNRSKYKHLKKLPGAKPQFLLGNLGWALQVYTRKSKYHPGVYALERILGYDHLFQKSGFQCVWLGWNPMISVSSPELLEVILSSNTSLEKSYEYSFLHRWLGHGLLTSTGPKWRTKRKLLTPCFHFRILDDFLPTLNDQSVVLVKKLQSLQNEDCVDITPLIVLCTLDIVCETVMGTQIGAQKGENSDYVTAVHSLGDFFNQRMVRPWLWFDIFFNISSLGRKFDRDLSILHNFTEKVIREKKNERLRQGIVVQDEVADDEIKSKRRRALMDLLLDLHFNGHQLSEEDIKEEVDTFMFEGHDTTAMGITFALYCIGLYPNVQKKIHEELDGIFGNNKQRPITMDDVRNMKYLECTIKESQRLYPSVPMIGRKLNEDIQYQEYFIPKGVTVHCDIISLHRRDDIFENAEIFNPERFMPEFVSKRHPYAFLPFSAGPRNCIGVKPQLLLGNLGWALQVYTRKSKYHPGVYTLERILGEDVIFRKSGFQCVWLGWSPMIAVYSPELLELILSSSTSLEKSYEYSFLHRWLRHGLLTSTGPKWRTKRKLLTPCFHFRILDDFLPTLNDQSIVLVKKLQSLQNEDSVDITPLIGFCTLDIVCETVMGTQIGAQKGENSDYVTAVHSLGDFFNQRAVRPWLWFDILFKISSLGRKFDRDLSILHNFTEKVIRKKKNERLRQGQVVQDEVADNEIKSKRRRALMDLLLDLHFNGHHLSEEDIKEEVDTFMFEGHDTTAMGITFALYCIGLYPDVQKKIHEELDGIFGNNKQRPITMDDVRNMKYLECTIKEYFIPKGVTVHCHIISLNRQDDIFENAEIFNPERFMPEFVSKRHPYAFLPFSAGPRNCIEEYFIPKGVTVHCHIISLHRRDDIFENAELFNPERFMPEFVSKRHPYAFLPFSAGPRNCIGQKFAMLEEKVVISNILRHFRIKSLDHRDKVHIKIEFTLRPAQPMRLQFFPRS
ncbi:unnamed protein product [Larinioides sclopetarius]|uniref:Cytochrome P450 n=1 Tax=Larinioides sclopetarius TaxID=280406 RepID=A0AAV2BWH9_9ARAC